MMNGHGPGGANGGGSAGAGGGGSGSPLHRELLEPSPMRRSGVSANRTPMLSISPSRIREIHDPCSLLLMQLHKILFITQLPPSLDGDGLAAERQVIDKYKRELFSHHNLYRGRNLKDELHKLMSGSHEMIDVAFRSPAALADADAVATGANFDAAASFGPKRTRISYEELQRAIERVLESTGYYDVKSDAEPAAPPPVALLPLGRPPLAPPHAHIEPPPLGRAASLPAPSAPPTLRNGIGTPRGTPGPSPLGAGARELPPVQGRGSRSNLHAGLHAGTVSHPQEPARAPSSARELPQAS